MIIKNYKTKNGRDYSIVADGWSNSRSWGHIATLVINNMLEVEEVKIRYYNRTWEVYQFQSVMQSVMSKYINKISIEAIKDYKTKHNIKRMSKDAKEDVILKDDEVQELMKIYKTL